MRRLMLVSVALISMTIPPVYSDGNDYGAGVYLRQGVGARALGMGGAFSGIADDATAGYWNPAGLAQMDLYLYELGSQYAFIADDVSMTYLSYALQWPQKGNFEISWMNFNSGEIERRDDQGNVTGGFIGYENAFFLSYGHKFYDWVRGLSLGASLKILQQGLGDHSAAGVGLDLGALWQPILYLDHTIGVNIQNIYQRLYWSTDQVDATPLNVKLGLALRFFPSPDKLYFNQLVTSMDLEFAEYSRFNARLGAEYWFLKSLGARAGYDGQGITAGVSYHPDYYEIAYAFRYDLGDLRSNQHRISIMLRFQGESAPAAQQPSISELMSDYMKTAPAGSISQNNSETK